jgi:hypothetical protein
MAKEVRCTSCGAEMKKKKGSLGTETCEEGCCTWGTDLYQCPECKNVELR